MGGGLGWKPGLTCLSRRIFEGRGTLPLSFPVAGIRKLPAVAENTEGPVSLCFPETRQSSKFSLQKSRIYTKRSANTT